MKEKEKMREMIGEREKKMREDDTLAYNIHSDDHGITSSALSAIIIAKSAFDVYALYSVPCMVHIHSSGNTSHFPASKSTRPGSPMLATPLVVKKVNRNGQVQWTQLL